MDHRTINLTFHGVGVPDRPLEEGEADVWVGSEDFLGVLDAVALRGGVRITFDDGNASDVEHALPALRARGLTADFFVVAGRLGTPGFLDEDGVRELSAAGMGVGCHGMRHRPWRRLSSAALHEELVDSRHVLEKVVGRPVTAAACPFGSYDRRVLGMLRRSGYRLVFTSDRGPARRGDWLQARNTVHRGDGAEMVDGILERQAVGGRLLRRSRLTMKRWR